ncbi:MAG: hypothetical protein LUE10_07580 [Alistipes sp.]|nr:hypothetical protein [Alistipes sp.]
MKKLYIISLLAIACTALIFGGCTKDQAPGGPSWGDGGLLNLSVSFGELSTRLSELGTPSDMKLSEVDGTQYGRNHVGLYIYYTSNYNNDDLSKPYVRNLECKIEGGNSLVPVLAAGQDPEDANIYIYDRMTIVAFYPYNGDMSLPENYFEKQTDEKSYYITKKDYSEQYYIPYRASTETNPTVSYYTQLTFYPRNTYKIEIVVVSDDDSKFVNADEVIILPNIDPIDTQDTNLDGKRVKWYDGVSELDDRGGGSNVRQYWSYIWTTDDDPNNIPRGEILLQAGELTLIASQDVSVQEQYVYRYGYNMSTGEIFIPTSTNLVWDAQSLADFRGGNTNTYQVCDIDLSVMGNWTPGAINRGRYDGGGHKVLNLTIDSDGGNVGLFSKISNSSVVCNVNLIQPQITVTSADSTSVGAICGKVNDVLTEDDIADLIGNLPEGLSEVVKQAIIADLLADAYSGTCRVVACRVEEPTITVTGLAPRVGTVVGEAGTRNDEEDYYSFIKDCYSLGGSLTVNSGNEAANEGGYVGGFCGLNNGTILRCYTTVDQIIFDKPDTDDVTLIPSYEGFTNMGTLFTAAEGAVLTDDYSVLADSNTGVSQMPGSWPSWTSGTPYWPVLTTGWISDDTSYWYDAGSPSANYPVLQWERR